MLVSTHWCFLRELKEEITHVIEVKLEREDKPHTDITHMQNTTFQAHTLSLSDTHTHINTLLHTHLHTLTHTHTIDIKNTLFFSLSLTLKHTNTLSLSLTLSVILTHIHTEFGTYFLHSRCHC